MRVYARSCKRSCCVSYLATAQDLSLNLVFFNDQDIPFSVLHHKATCDAVYLSTTNEPALPSVRNSWPDLRSRPVPRQSLQEVPRHASQSTSNV